MVTGHLDHVFAGSPDVTAYLFQARGRAAGVREVERLSATTAEVALLVAEDMHGRGVATLLLERAARDAHAAGVDAFLADVLTVNHECSGCSPTSASTCC